MKYKIIQGSLLYDPKITEEIFNEIIKAAKKQGCKFCKHWTDGGDTYEHFKKHRHLNFDVNNTTYEYGKGYVIDNNKQGLNVLTLEDIQEKPAIIDTYSMF